MVVSWFGGNRSAAWEERHNLATAASDMVSGHIGPGKKDVMQSAVCCANPQEVVLHELRSAVIYMHGHMLLYCVLLLG